MLSTLCRLLREWRSLALGLAGIGLMIAVFWASRHYPDIPWSSGGPPGDYPRVLAMLLGILSALVLAQTLYRVLQGQAHAAESPSRLPGSAIRRIACAAAVLLLSPILLYGLGYVVTGVIVCLSTMLCATEQSRVYTRTLAWMIIVALCAVFVLQFAFEDFGGRRLPTGVWFTSQGL